MSQGRVLRCGVEGMAGAFCGLVASSGGNRVDGWDTCETGGTVNGRGFIVSDERRRHLMQLYEVFFACRSVD